MCGGFFCILLLKLEGWSMSLNVMPMELEKIRTESISYRFLSPYGMLAECLATGDEAIIEQAWLCFAEFSVDHMVG